MKTFENKLSNSNKLGGKILKYITQFKTKCDSPVVAGQTLCLFFPSGRERFTLRRECVVVVVVALRESVAGGLKSARSCRGPASLAPPLPGTFTRHFLSSLTRARCVPTSQKKKTDPRLQRRQSLFPLIIISRLQWLTHGIILPLCNFFVLFCFILFLCVATKKTKQNNFTININILHVNGKSL